MSINRLKCLNQFLNPWRDLHTNLLNFNEINENHMELNYPQDSEESVWTDNYHDGKSSYNLKEIFEYPPGAIPWSLAGKNRELKKTNKASLLREMEFGEYLNDFTSDFYFKT